MIKILPAIGSVLALGIATFLFYQAKIQPISAATLHQASESNSQRLSKKTATPSHGRKSHQAPLLDQLNRIVKSSNSFDRELFSSVLAKLTRTHAAAAADYVASIPTGPIREEALRSLARIWISLDAANAELWAVSLPDELERQSAIADLCTQLAGSDAGQALIIAEKHGITTQLTTFTENLTQQWASQDFSAAARWIKARPAGESRDQMIMRLAFVQSSNQPAEAARLVVEEISAGETQTEAVISVIHQWGRHDMLGAREWVALFPASPLRTRAESELSSIATHQGNEP
ncbi:MAG: hypothetical protein V4640_13690 [Verrucomicrobiota bacterium]